MLPNLGPMEMMVVLVVAVLLFGRRLPEVGRSLGKGIIEFKKGIRGIDDDLDPASSSTSPRSSSSTPSTEIEPIASIPKFEPPSSAPVPHAEFEPQAYQD